MGELAVGGGTALHCPRCGIHIDVHPDGRCLDMWVAEWMGKAAPAPYSTSIAYAWEVVEKLQEMFEYVIVGMGNGCWCRAWTVEEDLSESGVWAPGETAPLAASRALIKAKANG